MFDGRCAFPMDDDVTGRRVSSILRQHPLAAISMLVGFALFLALAGFIVWDSRRLRNAKVVPLSREQMAKGYTPGSGATWKLLLVAAVGSTALGFMQWFEPSHPPFTGKLSWLYTVAYGALGPNGIAQFWWAIAVLLVLAAFSARRRLMSYEK